MILDIDTIELIPQRSPIVMVDRLVFYDEKISKTLFKIKEDTLFYTDGRFSEYGLLENIAQSCAARIGYVNLISKQPVKIGFIGAINNFSLLGNINPNIEIETKITVLSEVFTMTLVQAEVYQNNIKKASCEMKISLNSATAEV